MGVMVLIAFTVLIASVLGRHSTNYDLVFSNSEDSYGYIENGPMQLQGGGQYPPESAQSHFQWVENKCVDWCQMMMTDHNAPPLVLLPVSDSDQYQIIGAQLDDKYLGLYFNTSDGSDVVKPMLEDGTPLFATSVTVDAGNPFAYLTTDTGSPALTISTQTIF